MIKLIEKYLRNGVKAWPKWPSCDKSNRPVFLDTTQLLKHGDLSYVCPTLVLFVHFIFCQIIFYLFYVLFAILLTDFIMKNNIIFNDIFKFK